MHILKKKSFQNEGNTILSFKNPLFNKTVETPDDELQTTEDEFYNEVEVQPTTNIVPNAVEVQPTNKQITDLLKAAT